MNVPTAPLEILLTWTFGMMLKVKSSISRYWPPGFRVVGTFVGPAMYLTVTEVTGCDHVTVTLPVASPIPEFEPLTLARPVG